MGKQKTTLQFIEESVKIHGNKYDYSKTDYKKALEKVIITCPIHGDFKQTPNSHLYGRGCPKCGLVLAGEKMKEILSKSPKRKKPEPYTNERFINEANLVHNGKYDYSKSDVNNRDEKMKLIITCPEHGDFKMTISNHIACKQGCPECARLNRIKSKEKNKEYFINKANYIHSNFYNYNKVIYKRARQKVIITCPIHGDFEQSPDNHLKGCGCPLCQNSQLERKVRIFLIQHEIDFLPQYRPNWLKCDEFHSQSIDFYLPKYNAGIECHGIQHFKPSGNFGSKKISNEARFERITNLDDRKNKLCVENGLNLFYYTEEKIDNYRYEIYKNLDLLLEKILSLPKIN